MGGNGHYSPCSIFHEHEIGYVNGNGLPCKGMDCIASGEDTLLFRLAVTLAFKGRLPLFNKGPHLLFPACAFRKGECQGMLRGDAHEGNTKEGIWPCGKDLEDLFPSLYGKSDFSANALPYPVSLHGKDLFRPALEFVAALKKLLCIGGYPEKPAVKLPFHHLAVTSPAEAVFHLLVGKDSLARLAPVDLCLFHVNKALFQHLDEK